LTLQGVEGRAHHVVRVRSAERLRHHVLHAQRFEYRAHRAAGDDAGAGRGGAQIDAAGAVAAGHVMVQRAPFAQRHAGEPALGRLGRLADRLRHLARLAVAETDPAFLVADDDQGGKAEAAAALDHLGDAIDVDELVDEFAVALVAAAPLAWFTRHVAQPFCSTLGPVIRNSARSRARHRPAP